MEMNAPPTAAFRCCPCPHVRARRATRPRRGLPICGPRAALEKYGVIGLMGYLCRVMAMSSRRGMDTRKLGRYSPRKSGEVHSSLAFAIPRQSLGDHQFASRQCSKRLPSLEGRLQWSARRSVGLDLSGAVPDVMSSLERQSGKRRRSSTGMN